MGLDPIIRADLYWQNARPSTDTNSIYGMVPAAADILRDETANLGIFPRQNIGEGDRPMFVLRCALLCKLG